MTLKKQRKGKEQHINVDFMKGAKMSELNREQIIKALECCKTPLASDCVNCSYTGKRLEDGVYEGCVNSLVGDALSLIKQLTEEKKNFEYTLEGVMHSVDKWLDGAELEQDEVNRAITMREKTLRLCEELDCMIDNLRDDIDELKKKYIGEDTNVTTNTEGGK